MSLKITTLRKYCPELVAKKNIVKGFTTNPSLMRKAGAKDYKKFSIELIKLSKLNLFRLKFLEMTINP